jgi:hypothetical protein
MSKSGVKTAAAPITVLWMDDQPEKLKNYRDILARESNIQIDIATSIDEAQEKLKGSEGDININKYEAFIADCLMDPHDPSENGAEFLRRVNEIDKSFPTFVYSAWAQDPRFKGYLDQSYVILVEDKTGGFEHPLIENKFFRKIYEVGKEFQEIKELQPEKILFSHFIKDPKKYEKEVQAHWKKHGRWIAKDLKKVNWLWGVICGEEVIVGSDDLFDYPNETKLIEIGQAYNLIPFAYSEPILPENTIMSPGPPDIPWNTTLYKNDFYPAIRVRLGDIEIQEDFDTGATQTFVAEELVKKSIFHFLREYRTESHLGNPYEFLTKQIEICLIDSSGKMQTKELPVAVVKNWASSPFTSVNPKRRVLLGRDLLRAFQVEVCLDSLNHITRVRFLE